MKEILFRGKVVDNSAWIHGFFVNCRDYYDDEDSRTPEIISVNAERQYAGEYDHWECYPVIEGTVGQWTGLYDNNGTMIFEGDIIEWFYGNVAVVKYNVNSASFAGYVGKFDEYYFGAREREECKVIGNIWDNPELVEEV